MSFVSTRPLSSSPARGAKVEARPSPGLARLLSRAVPGLGQFYCGAILTGLIFTGAAVFLVLSMLQAWGQWGRSGTFLLVAPLVVGLYVLNATLGGWLAGRRAERMERHAAIWRGVDWWWRSGSPVDSAAEIVLLAAFTTAAAGVLLRWPFAAVVADYLRYWPVFELLGGFSVGFYAGFIDGYEERSHGRISNRSVALGFVAFQCVAALALWRMFALPLGLLAAALALTLPGHVSTFIAINGTHREEAKLRAGAILISLFLSFAAAGIITEELVRSRFRGPEYAPFPSMLMGTFYTALRIALDAFARKMKEPDPPDRA